MLEQVKQGQAKVAEKAEVVATAPVVVEKAKVEVKAEVKVVGKSVEIEKPIVEKVKQKPKQKPKTTKRKEAKVLVEESAPIQDVARRRDLPKLKVVEDSRQKMLDSNLAISKGDGDIVGTFTI